MGQITHEDLNVKLSEEIKESTRLSESNKGKIKEQEEKTASLPELQSDFTEHVAQIASTEKLGHIKVDGTTISVDPITGVASAQEQGYQLTNGVINKTPPSNDYNDVVEPGMYNMPDVGALNSPGQLSSSGKYNPSLLVMVSDNGDGTNTISQLVIGYSGAMFTRTNTVLISNGWTAWNTIPRGLNNTLTSTSTTQAATANAVKQVNDKIESPVVELQALAGWNSIAGGDYLKVVKIGKVVTFSGKITLTVSNNNYSMMVLLPVGYRPLGTIIVPVSGSTKKNTVPPSFFHGVINESGYLFTGADLVVGTGTQISDLTIGNKYSFTTSFIVN